MKKFVGISVAVVLMTGGGYYLYSAQQFAHNADQILKIIDRAKPVLSFGKIEVNKYAFKIRFENMEINTQSTVNTVGEEPSRLQMMSTLVLCYNPLTRTASLKATEDAFPLKLTQGSIKRDLHYTAKGEPKVTLSFTKSPDFNNFKFLEFLGTIKEISAYRPKTSMMDVQTQKTIMSVDPTHMNLKLHIPEKDQDNVDIKLTYDIHNLFIDKAFYKSYTQLLVGAMPTPQAQHIAQRTLLQIAALTYNATEQGEIGFKIKKESLRQIMEGNYNFLQGGIPTMNLFYEIDHSSDIADFKTDMDVKFAPKLMKLKLDAKGKFKPGIRELYADVLFPALRSNIPFDLPQVSPETILDIMPDLSSLGDVTATLDMEGNLENKAGKFDVFMGSNQYHVKLKGNYKGDSGGKIEAEFLNLDQGVTDLKAYLNRVFAHEKIKQTLSQDTVDQVMKAITLGQETLETLGKQETKNGNTILKIEQDIPSIPLALLSSMVPSTGMKQKLPPQ
jgi:hypothetical protein